MALAKRYLPWIALIAVWILWGSTYSAIRVGVETIPPYLMIGTRYIIAGGLLWLLQIAFAKEKPAFPSLAELKRIAIVGVLLLTIGNGFLAIAETRVPSGIASLIVASLPIFMLLLEAIRTRTAIGWSSTVGLILGSAGIVLLVGEPSGRANVFYATLILVGTFAWAFGTIYARGEKRHHPLSVPLEMIVGGTVAVVLGLVLGEGSHFSLARVSTDSLLGMLWLITGGAMAGYTAFAYIVRMLPASTVATYGYVNPVVAVLLGATLLHEPVTWNIVAGGSAVLASVLVILIGNRRDAVEVATSLSEDAA